MGLHFVLCSMENQRNTTIQNALVYISFFGNGSFYLFIYFQFLRRCFKDANFSAIIQNPMEKPVGFLSREPRSTLTSGLANIRHPSTNLL